MKFSPSLFVAALVAAPAAMAEPASCQADVEVTAAHRPKDAAATVAPSTISFKVLDTNCAGLRIGKTFTSGEIKFFEMLGEQIAMIQPGLTMGGSLVAGSKKTPSGTQRWYGFALPNVESPTMVFSFNY